jgi:protein gp37
VNSTSDISRSRPAEFVGAIWRAMKTTPQHTYQILTKRPDGGYYRIAAGAPNVWLGTSVESADYLTSQEQPPGRHLGDFFAVTAALRSIRGPDSITSRIG